MRDIRKNWYLTLNKSDKNAPMRLGSDFRTAVTLMNRLHRESGEERPEPIPFHQDRLYRLQDRLQLMAICCNRRGGKQCTSHVTFFPCLCALVMLCHTTLAQVFVRVISSTCHTPECLISLRPSLCTLHLSLPSSISSFDFHLSSSMWMSSEQDHLCTSPNEESGPFANNARLTVFSFKPAVFDTRLIIVFDFATTRSSSTLLLLHLPLRHGFWCC